MGSTLRFAMAGGIIAGLICTAVRAQDPAPQSRASITQIGWLTGAWEGAAGQLTLEERWTPPAGGAMLGVSRTVKDGRMIAFEFLRIVEREGGLVYIAQPDGRPPTEFTLTRLEGETAVFENPAHDFPKVIRYSRRTDTLEAQISGEPPQRPRTFTFQRMDGDSADKARQVR